MYLDDRSNHIEFQGPRSDVKITWPNFRFLSHCKIKTFVDMIT